MNQLIPELIGYLIITPTILCRVMYLKKMDIRPPVEL